MLSRLTIVALASSAFAAPVHEHAASKAVDYVIIGGGPAGFVLLEQLSRNASKSVVLLEAGPDGINDTGILSESLVEISCLS